MSSLNKLVELLTALRLKLGDVSYASLSGKRGCYVKNGSELAGECYIVEDGKLDVAF